MLSISLFSWRVFSWLYCNWGTWWRQQVWCRWTWTAGCREGCYLRLIPSCITSTPYEVSVWPNNWLFC